MYEINGFLIYLYLFILFIILIIIFFSDIFKTIISKSVDFDDEGVVKLWIGPRLLVFVYDPRDVELILSSHVHIDKAEDYRFFQPWLGNGLLISTGKLKYLCKILL